MSMTSGSFSLPYVPTPDNTKQLWSSTIAFGAAPAPAIVNPPNLMQGVTTYNPSAYWLRGVVTYSAGITSNGPATEHCFMVPPFGVDSFDLSAHDQSAGGVAVPSIDSISYELVALGTTTQGSNGLVPLAAIAAPVVCVANFRTA
jgi:hypothetical protein